MAIAAEKAALICPRRLTRLERCTNVEVARSLEAPRCERQMTGSDRQRGKPYVEAFPMLSLLAARRAWAKGQRVIEWRNEEGVVIGHVELVSMSDAAVVFRHQFFGTPNVEESSGINALVACERKVNPQRVAREFVCSAAECNIDKIYFVSGKWSCRNCHGVGYVIQRLSPVYKRVVQRDALEESLITAPLQKRCTRDYHNAMRKLEKLRRETAEICTLPRELAFRCLGRWLEIDELPKPSIASDESGYGWAPGEWRGLKAFITPDPPPPPQPPEYRLLSRLPPEPALVGLRLFKGDLERFVAEHFLEEGQDVALQAIRGRLPTQELACLIADAAAIEKLHLETADLQISDWLDDQGEPRMITTLPYSGSTTLLQLRAPGTLVPANLRANYNQNTITFGIIVREAERRRAEQVIRSGVWLVKRQLQAQGELLARYQANLAQNAAAFAALVLDARKSGKAAGTIKVSIEN